MDPKGYYNKFLVVRRDTNETVQEHTFTLIPERDPHAVVALRAYIESVQDENPDLARDLYALLAGLAHA